MGFGEGHLSPSQIAESRGFSPEFFKNKMFKSVVFDAF